jgi:signal transduction histidine kinase
VSPKADSTVALRDEAARTDRPASALRPLAATGHARRAADSERGPSYVLFVDDDDANLVVWEAACSEQFNVLTARSAEQAMDLLRDYEVGVILADQRMPNTTGIELLEHVRSEFPDTIRILITAYSDLTAAIDAINRGHVRRYLKKPCALPELRAEIIDALDLYGLRRRVGVAERRLLLTERVYSLGIVAASIGRELCRPAGWIKDSVTLAQAEVHALTKRLGEDADVRGLPTRMLEVEAHLARALQGVERVLDIAHSVEAPDADKDTEAVEFTEVLRLALKSVRGEIRHGTDMQLDIRTVPPVRCTSAKLGQVALNLLANAIEAVSEQPPGERAIVVRLFELDGSVRLEVMDNGPAIAEADAPRLFDPFHAAGGPRGSGLGLAISRAIVEEAGGTLDVAHPAGGGALFRVVLPRYLRRAEGD